jgi:hypothetical protein
MNLAEQNLHSKKGTLDHTNSTISCVSNQQGNHHMRGRIPASAFPHLQVMNEAESGERNHLADKREY